MSCLQHQTAGGRRHELDDAGVGISGRYIADGPRYKALGNIMAVPVMRWIGERIQLVDDLIDKDRENEARDREAAAV